MSVKAMGWAYDQRAGHPVLKAVLVALADNANDEGFCWPSFKEIARKAEISARTAQRAVKRLEENGLVIVERERVRADGSRSSNGYRLPIHSMPLALDPPVTICQGRQIDTHDTASHGGHDTGVTPNEPSLEPSQKTLIGARPDWLPPEWEEFLADRKERRKPLTKRATVIAIENLATLRAEGQDIAAVLKQSIERGWSGLFEVKATRAQPGTLAERNRAAADAFVRDQERQP